MERLLFNFLQSFGYCKVPYKMTNNFVWIDLEMTGLNVEKDTILEIACLITKPDLQKVDKGFNLVIHQPEEVLNSMNAWCTENHQKTGLTEASRNSKISLAEAEEQVSSYIKQFTDPAGFRYLTGSSVGMDKMFLQKYMPKVDSLLHYRIIDVSSIKTLCCDWYPEEFKKIEPKKLTHRALEDIEESLEELKKYRKIFFV